MVVYCSDQPYTCDYFVTPDHKTVSGNRACGSILVDNRRRRLRWRLELFNPFCTWRGFQFDDSRQYSVYRQISEMPSLEVAPTALRLLAIITQLCFSSAYFSPISLLAKKGTIFCDLELIKIFRSEAISIESCRANEHRHLETHTHGGRVRRQDHKVVDHQGKLCTCLLIYLLACLGRTIIIKGHYYL